MQYILLAFAGIGTGFVLLALLALFSNDSASGVTSSRRLYGLKFICGERGDMGSWDDSKTSSSESQQTATTDNKYTDEQNATLKNILNSSSNVTSTLGSGLTSLLSSALNGDLTTANKSALRTGKEENANTYKNLATQSSEALASKGTLNSGMANKVMDNLQTEEAKANQSTYNTILQNQQDSLYKTIASALGLTSLAGNLSTASRGTSSTSSGTSSSTMSDIEALTSIINAFS